MPRHSTDTEGLTLEKYLEEAQTFRDQAFAFYEGRSVSSTGTGIVNGGSNGTAYDAVWFDVPEILSDYWGDSLKVDITKHEAMISLLETMAEIKDRGSIGCGMGSNVDGEAKKSFAYWRVFHDRGSDVHFVVTKEFGYDKPQAAFVKGDVSTFLDDRKCGNRVNESRIKIKSYTSFHREMQSYHS
ncbi:hypothetical protein HN695_05315 [Candidatus Woesearchaeota archaeon]|jgi:hypothetical protein|nr:hypothetical protein [Candidatus Woesearchaeota archaeon]MBT5272157.1 hypothetical protein [Candidatus Woesearchaeota archaeon]MBT6040484.1 hypothetical protein [Candidatus Woesearchaeota archaeon]MBT6336863.1 hypothetical protein [Candidatus Woesearchaeota archaeon]MBT7927733.1 hypothetical protein [Candidatus Woesearchaeota archaeon]